MPRKRKLTKNEQRIVDLQAQLAATQDANRLASYQAGIAKQQADAAIAKAKADAGADRIKQVGQLIQAHADSWRALSHCIGVAASPTGNSPF